MRRRHFVILLSLTLLAACTKGKIYHHYNHTPIAGWEKVDTLTFNIPKVAEKGRYSTDLGLRINSMYPFTRLTLIVEQTVFPSHQRQIDTLNCKLIDSKGFAKGQGISHYQYKFPVSQMQLDGQDSVHISVRHDMKREILPGISDVGIAFYKLK